MGAAPLLNTVDGRAKRILWRWWPLVVILAAQVTLLRGGVRWWSGDDPQLLKHAMSHHYWEFFFSPSAWQELTASNWTPWVSLSLKVDWDLFGLAPAPYHLHQALSILLMLSLLYGTCVMWLDPLASLVAVAAFMLSRPMVEAGEMLMLRHYVEGLAFCLMAILCYRKSVQESRGGWSIAAGLFYGLACTAKEIYLLLPLCLLAVPLAGWRDRLRRLSPMFALLSLLLVWRMWMLGGPVGGYGRDIEPAQILLLPLTTLQVLGLDRPLSLLFLSAMACFLMVAGKKEWKAFIITLTVGVLLPLIPVSGAMAVRYAFLPALVLALLLGWCVTRLTAPKVVGRRLPLAVAVALAGLGQLWWSNVNVWRPVLRSGLDQARVEGSYVLSQGTEHDFIKNPAGSPWFYEGLGWLRTSARHLSPGPQAFEDPVVLWDKRDYHVLVYDRDARALVEAKDFGKEMEQFRRTMQPKASLTVDLQYEEPIVHWELGPWRQGSYAFLFEDFHQIAYPVPRQGQARVRFSGDRIFRVRYSSPEGWVTYSPLLLLEVHSGAARLEWQR